MKITKKASLILGKANQLFCDRGSYHIEISPLICSANQWACFYMIRTSVMKELLDAYIGQINVFKKISSLVFNPLMSDGDKNSYIHNQTYSF